MDLVISKHGQVMRATPELAPLSLLPHFPNGEGGGWEDETRVRHEGENGRAQEGGLLAPRHVRGAPRTQWEGKCCYFFFGAAGMKKKRVCKEKLTDATAGVTKLEPALTLIPVNPVLYCE
ncbi:hypothetical protein TNCV_4275551 [Trichonephila clavipes]|nr:hypothetical protein TNCV_4275551 [Trichonephila clavipes]